MAALPVCGSNGREVCGESTGCIPTGHSRAEIDILLDSSLSDSTKATYDRSLKAFESFRHQQSLPRLWPPPLEHVAEFVAHMSIQGFAPATARAYVSGLSFRCKIQNLQDHTQNFIIRKLLSGYGRVHKRIDFRLPISHEMLVKIIKVLPFVCSTVFESTLFKALLSVAFYGFLRIGELVAKSAACVADNKQSLLASNVYFEVDLARVSLILASSKTDQHGKGVRISVATTGDATCPVRNLHLYFGLRHRCKSPVLFCHVNNCPVTRYQFTAVLKNALAALGIKQSNIKSHSFRIGAATSA